MSRDLRWAQYLAKPNFPKYVLHVMHTVASSAKFDGLSNRSREVLYYLSSLVDTKRRDATIFATKKTISQKTGCSEPTVYRALGEIQKAGLIFRNTQQFNPESGFFRIGEIQFTETFFEIVGHPVNTKTVSQDPAESGPSMASSESTSQANSSQGAHLPTKPSINLIDNTGIKPSYLKENKSEGSSSEKPGPRRLPESLRWLVEQGLMTDKQVVNVMWKAKQVKQRLQDLIEVKREAIKSGQIKNLAGYLWKLLDSGDDFSYVARKAREASDCMHKASALADELQAFLSTLTGKVIRLAKGGMLRPYGGNMMEYIDANGYRRGVSPVTASWYEQIKAAGFELVEARLAMEAAP